MTTRKPLLIGPFSKGLNTYDDPTAIDDRELVEALNFDPGFDGSLRSRPPFTDTGAPLTLGATGSPRMLGFFYDNSNVPYLIVSDGLSSTWQYSGSSWSLITSTFAASDMVQFDGKAWLLSPVGETDPGGSWNPALGFVPDTDMPRGTSIASYKSRLWVAQGLGGANPTRLYYSKALGQPSFWASPGFIDVGSGDGESVIKIVQYFETLLIFRTKSIWTFQYGIDPATATQGVLVPGVGLQSNRSLVGYENYLYFMYDEKAYQFINNRVQQINIKVPFRSSNKASTSDPFHVSLFSNRILYSYYDVLYVYSLRTQTWTTWKSDAWGPMGQIMSSYVSGDTDEAYALPSVRAAATMSVPLLRIEDRFGVSREEMTCKIQTKNYNFEVPGSYKVLFWWGLDAIFRTTVTAQVSPIVFNSVAMWGQVREQGHTWGSLRLGGGTWRFPLDEEENGVISEVVAPAGPARKFVKFFKKLRFRQLFFRIKFTNDGSSATAPVQIFTISTYMAEKETVSQQVS